jgi:hypothetical protein
MCCVSLVEYIYMPAAHMMAGLAAIEDFLTRMKFMIFGSVEVAASNSTEECL